MKRHYFISDDLDDLEAKLKDARQNPLNFQFGKYSFYLANIQNINRHPGGKYYPIDIEAQEINTIQLI